MRTIFFIAAFFFMTANSAKGQESKFFLRTFPNYKIDTVRIEGNPVLMKRHVISVLHREGVKSAFWDETSNILTVEYDGSLVQLSDITNYFYNSAKVKNNGHVVKVRADY